jgi:dihydrofolate reductase
MEDPGGSEQSEVGGWTAPYWTNQLADFQLTGMRAADALLVGRITYDLFAAAWPSMTDQGEFAERMNGYPKYVASRTLTQFAWNNSHPLEGDLAAVVSRMKRGPGEDILVYGNGSIVRTLLRAGLLDQLNLIVYPVILGGGKRLFDAGSVAKLRGVETRPFDSGVVVLAYQAAAVESHVPVLVAR